MLRQQIAQAIEFPYTKEAVTAYEYKEKELIHRFVEGEFDKDELWDRLSELEQNQPPIILANNEELRHALWYMDIEPDEAKRISNDLLFGYWKAELLHLPTRLILKIYKTDIQTAFFVGIQINLNDRKIDDRKAREYLQNE